MRRDGFNSRKATPEELDAYRRQIAWIPKDNVEVIERDTTDAIVYRWDKQSAKGQPRASSPLPARPPNRRWTCT